MSLVQNQFRYRDDDGSESAATWLAALNTDTSLDVDTNYRMRFEITGSGGGNPQAVGGQLQYNHNAAGWVNVTASSSVVQASASSQFADDATTTMQIGTSSGDFVSGRMDEDDGNVTNVTLDKSKGTWNTTELEYCFQIVGADVADNDTIQLRVIGVDDDTTALDIYTNTPSITVNKAVDPSIIAEQGAYTLSGQSANLLHNRKITAGQGSYSVSGQDATLTRAITITAESGSISLSGQDASLIHGRVIAADSGSYSFSGQDAALSRQITITAEQGSYTLTGQISNLLWNKLIAAAQGSYSLSGQDATLTKSGGESLTADQGSYALSGQSANLLWGKAVKADQGSYSIMGQSSTLLWKRVFTAEQGSYALAGQNAVLSKSGATPTRMGHWGRGSRRRY